MVAIGGLFLLLKYEKELSGYLLISFLAFYLLVSFHTAWDGLSSFGSRFFVSLTPYYVLGLAISFRELARFLKNKQRALVISSVVTVALILWNTAFIFQWGTHMVPARGPISWKQMVRNQFLVVPQRAESQIAAYFGNRRVLMHQIEQEDIRQLRQQGVDKPK
jgi:hypothetical protein